MREPRSPGAFCNVFSFFFSSSFFPSTTQCCDWNLHVADRQTGRQAGVQTLRFTGRTLRIQALLWTPSLGSTSCVLITLALASGEQGFLMGRQPATGKHMLKLYKNSAAEEELGHFRAILPCMEKLKIPGNISDCGVWYFDRLKPC